MRGPATTYEVLKKEANRIRRILNHQGDKFPPYQPGFERTVYAFWASDLISDAENYEIWDIVDGEIISEKIESYGGDSNDQKRKNSKKTCNAS